MQIINPPQRSKFFILFYYFRTLKWKASADEASQFVDGGKLPCVLVENKVDLLPPEEQDNTQPLKEFADKNGYSGSFRASAKTGKNINESMLFLIETIVTRLEGINTEGKPDAGFTTDRKSVVLDKKVAATKKDKKKDGECC